MADLTPFTVRDSKAAKMLDLSTKEFLELVAVDALPGPLLLGPHPRWSVALLKAVADGQAGRPNDEDIE